LARVPDCLDAVIRLAEAGLALEAHTIVRTIVEMAITLCWVGLDEQRAQAIWDRSIDDFQKGLGRVPSHSPVQEEIAAWVAELRASHGGTTRPSVQQMAKDALDTEELLGRRMAKTLYDYLYDPLSAASHGDLRFAKLIVNGQVKAFVPSALNYAVAATDFLLIAASAQLGFRPDFQKFLEAQLRPNPMP
jgi:hypothetical protein